MKPHFCKISAKFLQWFLQNRYSPVNTVPVDRVERTTFALRIPRPNSATARVLSSLEPDFTNRQNRHSRPIKSITYKAIPAKNIGLEDAGETKFEGDKQNFSGHKSRSMMERYNRSPDKTNVIDWRE